MFSRGHHGQLVVIKQIADGQRPSGNTVQSCTVKLAINDILCIINGGTLEIARGIAAGGTSLVDVLAGKAVLKTVNVDKTDLDVNTAELATFEVASGTHQLGAIQGGGRTQIDSGATLTVASIYQGELSIGSGAILIIQGSAAGALDVQFTPVPEPSVLLMFACAFVVVGLKGMAPIPRRERRG